MHLVEQYNEQIANLQNSQLRKKYREEIQNIWTDIYDNGGLLKADGICKNIKQCRVRPPAPDG
jgi:hypothetical protein